MGDRGNIVLLYKGNQEIFLYTHWRGSDIADILKNALSKKQRWDDPAYLSRMIFGEMVEGAYNRETGFGISPYLQDNEHNLLVVDLEKNEVHEETEGRARVGSWTFTEFLARPVPHD